ncbi:MAG: hypothetical protein ACTSP4_02265 [Candidatus Hodarchaeales archaeon]
MIKLPKTRRIGIPFSAWIPRDIHQLLKEQAKKNNHTLTQEITIALEHYFEHVRVGSGIIFMKKASPYLIKLKRRLDSEGYSSDIDDLVLKCILEGSKSMVSFDLKTEPTEPKK